MSLEPGVQLSQYKILQPLGAGGMGEVYRAHDTRLDRDVALKVLPAHLASDAAALERFEREARAVAALSHPNILAIHDFGAHEGTAYAVTELLEGETLRARLEHSGMLPAKKAVQIAADVASGLAAAHDRHIVHRDLKPENIFLLSDGQVKVLDFGLAKTLLPGTSSDTATGLSTDPGVVLGTVGYMAPEQVRGEAADSRSDIFALGCVLFEMSTGARPFTRPTVAETMTAILREDSPELSASSRNVSPALGEVIRHCLEKRPAERFQSARDLAFALRALSGSQTSSGATAAAAGPAGGGPRFGVVAAVIVTLLLGAGLGWWAASLLPDATSETWSSLTQLTDQTGAEDMPVIAPDGGSIAYASQAAGSTDIYVQRIGGRNATIVAGDRDRDEAAPAFSPDGGALAFHEADPDGGIFIVGATGESVRRVTEAGFHPAWSPDGQSIAFCDEQIRNPASRTVRSALSVVDVATGQVRRVTDGDAAQPAWSPSGRRLAYWGQTAGQRDIFTIPASGGEPVKVTDDIALDWSVVWAPDGRYLRIRRDGSGLVRLSNRPINSLWYPFFEPSGRRVWAFDSQRRGALVLSVEAGDQPAAQVGDDVPLMPVEGGLFRAHGISRDGQRLSGAAYSAAGTRFGVGWHDLATGKTEVSTVDSGPGLPAWLPDGRSIFLAASQFETDVWMVERTASPVK